MKRSQKLTYRNQKYKCFRKWKTAFFVFLLFLTFIPGKIFSSGIILPDRYPGKEINNSADMAFVPSGTFIMGANDEELTEVIKNFGHRGDFENYDFKAETPRRNLFLSGYYIDKHEVTNIQYEEFVRETGHNPPRHWYEGKFPPEKGNNPVLYVNWFDANDYCAWQGKRLPTDEEWEKAARGKDGRQYPWGNEYDPDMAVTAEYVLKYFNNLRELTVYAAPVDDLRGDKSPYGVYDMAGNVMEWTSSPYDSGKTKVVKGASWLHLHARARTSAKEGVLPLHMSHMIGFRCAMGSDIELKQVYYHPSIYDRRTGFS